MQPNTHSQETIDLVWRGFLVIIACVAATMLPWEAVAQWQSTGATNDTYIKGQETSLDRALCNVINWFNGPIGKGIATIALIVVGVGALMGKVSWGLAIIVGLGVAIIFGATTVVSAIGGGGEITCTDKAMIGNVVGGGSGGGPGG